MISCSNESCVKFIQARRFENLSTTKCSKWRKKMIVFKLFLKTSCFKTKMFKQNPQNEATTSFRYLFRSHFIYCFRGINIVSYLLFLNQSNLAQPSWYFLKRDKDCSTIRLIQVLACKKSENQMHVSSPLDFGPQLFNQSENLSNFFFFFTTEQLVVPAYFSKRKGKGIEISRTRTSPKLTQFSLLPGQVNEYHHLLRDNLRWISVTSMDRKGFGYLVCKKTISANMRTIS